MKPLLAQVRRGDRAFARLYRRHVGDVYRYALVLLRNPTDAEDVTQTTFLNAYRAFGRGERPANSRAWLLALAHNVCRRRVHAPTVDLDSDDAVRAVPDAAPPTSAEIRRALARLPFDQRAALVMRELEGRPYAEIAQVLQLSGAAVETLVFEARHALREQLEGALTCHQAERAISLQVDGRLPRSERRSLRAHLRECTECDRFARSQRAQRSAWKTLAAVPLPASLQSFFGPGGVLSGGGNAVGGIAVVTVAKALAVAALGAAAVGLGYENGGSESAIPVVQERDAPSAAGLARPAGRPTPSVRLRSRSAPAATKPTTPRTASVSAAATAPTLARASTPARATRPAHAQPPPPLPVRSPARPEQPAETQTAAGPPKHEPKQAAPAEEAPAPAPADPPPAAPPPLLPFELPQFPPAPPLPLPAPPRLP